MRYAKIHDRIVEICRTAKTLSEVEARIGTSSPNGALRRYIKLHGIELPEYLGQSAANAISQKTRKRITEADLCEGSLVCRTSLKAFLFREGLKYAKCEICGWCEARLSDGVVPIHLHHLNGDGTDNRLENLQILCPNHHALTDDYCKRNKVGAFKRKIVPEVLRQHGTL